MSGSTAAAYGRAKALDQQDLGHYITKSIIMPNPLIFKCEWESIEQKKDKKKKKRNLTRKRKKIWGKNAKNQCAPFVCGFNFVYILYERFNNITMLKVLVLSLYNSVLNTCSRDSRKRRRNDAPTKITRKRTKTCVRNNFFRIILFISISHLPTI